MPASVGRARTAAAAAALLLGAVCGWWLIHENVRLLIAILLILSMGLAVFRWPETTVVLLCAWLPVLELIRRLLIPWGGWSSNDPLLLVAPAVVVLYTLIRSAFWRPWNLLTRLMVVLLAVCCVEAVTPLGAGVRANVVGSLFVTFPVLWFFVGRTLRPASLDWLVSVLPLAGIPVALYGLHQLIVGYLPWDQRWIDLQSYAALSLGTFIRPFGTFASAAEYEVFLLCCGVVAAAVALRARSAASFVYLPLAAGYFVLAFFDGSRTGMVTSVAALGVLWAYRTRGRRGLRLLVTLGAAAAGYLLFVHGHQITLSQAQPATAAGSAAFHQVQGLTQPLNSKSSTMSTHVQMFVNGILSGFRHPLGEGLGTITLAGSRFGTAAASSEIDLSNLFLAGGVAGGCVYLAVVAVTAVQAMSGTVTARIGTYALPAVLLVTSGQWLNGGYYFVSALVWLLVGQILGSAAAGPSARRAIEPSAPGLGSARAIAPHEAEVRDNTVPSAAGHSARVSPGEAPSGG